MSAFDKAVASWVSSAESRPREEREALLSNIHKNLETYRDLQNPSETYARKRAEQKCAEEEKAAAEAAKRAELDELKKQEKAARRAGLPPLPPSSHSTEKNSGAQGAKAKKGKRAADTAAQPTKKTETSAPAGTSDRQLSATDKSALDAGRLQVYDVDYHFDDDVSEALRRLRAGEQGPLLREAYAPPVNTAVSVSSSTSGESKKKKVSAVAPHRSKKKAATRTFQDLRDFPLDAQASSGEQANAGDAAVRKSQAGSGSGHTPPPQRGKPPTLATLAQDHADAEDLHEDMTIANNKMQLFSFGAETQNSASDKDSDVEDVARFAETVAGAGPLADMDDSIDDREDARRRAQHQKRPSRCGISDVSINLDEARSTSFPETPKSRDKVRTISTTLAHHYLFSSLDDADIARFASIMDLEHFTAGEEVLTRGVANGALYLILSGSAVADVFYANGPKEHLQLGKGDTFGDIGLMYESHSESTVRATTDLQCASLERHTYKMLTWRAMEERRARYAEFIESVPFFSGLSKVEKTRLAESLKTATYQKEEKIIEADSPSPWLFFVVEGTLEVTGQHGEKVATVKKGEFVGHIEFLFHHVAVANVVAVTPIVRTAKLSRRQFDRLVGDARAPLEKEVQQGESYEYYRRAMKSATPPRDDIPTAFDEPPAYVQRAAPDA